MGLAVLDRLGSGPRDSTDLPVVLGRERAPSVTDYRDDFVSRGMMFRWVDHGIPLESDSWWMALWSTRSR